MANWRNPGAARALSIVSGAKVMVNNDIVFTASGMVKVLDLVSECMSNNDATATTIQWKNTPTVGSAATFSGACTTLASKAAGATVVLTPTALTTAMPINASSAGLGSNSGVGIVIPGGTLFLVVGVGSTTGTWKHHIRYVPLTPGAIVVANQ